MGVRRNSMQTVKSTGPKIENSQLEKALNRFNVNTVEELQTAVGAGDVRINQLINYLHGHE